MTERRMTMASRREDVTLDTETEQMMHKLFQTKKAKKRLLEHYKTVAELYGKVIKESPYGTPPLEIFCGLVSETFIENMAYLTYGLKSSVLFNVTASEEEGLTYKEIAERVTNLMIHYESELEKVEDIRHIRKNYIEQMKMLRDQGVI